MYLRFDVGVPACSVHPQKIRNEPAVVDSAGAEPGGGEEGDTGPSSPSSREGERRRAGGGTSFTRSDKKSDIDSPDLFDPAKLPLIARRLASRRIVIARPAK